MRIATRDDWGATAPVGPQMALPSTGLVLHHTVTALTVDAYDDMRTVEAVGVRRFGIISYSWCYHLHSRLFLEGAGNTVGAHTGGQNSTTHGLALIGNFSVRALPDYAVADLGEFIGYGADRGWWARTLLGGHRDVKATACPGDNAYARIPDIRTAITPPAEEEDVEGSILIRNATTQAVSLITPAPAQPKGKYGVRIYNSADRERLEARFGATIELDELTYADLGGKG